MAAGPLAPILAGVALAIPLVISLLGDPKAKRDAQIDRELRNNRFVEPTALSLDFNQAGKFTDRDSRGLIRASDFSNFPVNVREPARFQFDGQNVDVPGQQFAPFGPRQSGRGTPTIIVNQNIQNMDAKSFIDNAALIAEATRHAISNGRGDSLVSEIRSQTRTQ